MTIITAIPTLVTAATICYLIVTKVKLWDAYKCLEGHMQANDTTQREVKRLKEEIEKLHRQHGKERSWFERDLKDEADRSRSSLHEIREDLKASRKLNKEKQSVIDSYVFSDITSIKFTAHVPNDGWKRTEFKLGIGSCGKEVTALHWVEKDDRYELTQTCTDGERKEFTYYKKDVAGRIEIAYKVANTTH